MLIGQLTDIHLGFAPDGPEEELNKVRLRAVLARLLDGPNLPDMLVLSGDLTEHGDAASFTALAELVSASGIAAWPMVGNHDTREALLRAFPSVAAQGGFVHYTIEQGGLRVIMLDTLEPGRHSGAFCKVRARWLAAQLDAAPGRPTVIFMHHPPVVSGIAWMDPDPGASWIERFGAAVEGRRQILAIHCGHLHRTLATRFRGIPLHVCPSVDPQVALDLTSIDDAYADGRELIAAEPPAYALLRWDGERLVTHYEHVGDWHVLARYTNKLQPMVKAMAAERGL
ncbi:MAG: metallophosphoesterase [Croceibacterium sp.]